MTFREHMMNGTGRRPASLVLAILCGCVAWKFWPPDSRKAGETLASIQKGAFVTMAFAVTAYNLRTRVVDLLLKGSYKPSHIARLSETARACSSRLTWLVVLFTFTSLGMATATFFDFSHLFARASAAFVAALFAGSVVSFLYILFAFERLENFVLQHAVEETKQKEIERLSKSTDERIIALK